MIKEYFGDSDKILDSFEFEQDSKKFKVELELMVFTNGFCEFWINLIEVYPNSQWKCVKIRTFGTLFFAKRYYNKLKKKWSD